MKKSFTAFLIIILIFSFNCVIAQTGNLSITQTNDGSVIDVNIYIKRTGAIPGIWDTQVWYLTTIITL
ncbi:MAG: hypothetical protein IPI04_19415 [Ignavibacteria bacterium]|nr:hypothetical protein [Ignavibacteria bacterium]